MRRRLLDRLAAGFSIVLLGSLAGFSYYLAEFSSRLGVVSGERRKTHEPDYFVEGLSLTRTNARGEPSFRLSAQRLLHYPDDDTSEFIRPVLVSLDASRPRVTLSAERGVASGDGEQTRLHDQVLLVRAAAAGGAPLRVSTDEVLLLPRQDIARTDRPVRIEQGDSVLTGVGMEFDNAARTLSVLSRVQGRWAGASPRPPAARP